MSTVRPRTDHDLDACVRVLAAVHERDGYPVSWPESAAGWLAPASLTAAWVAESAGRVAGHVALFAAAPDDLAPRLLAARTGTAPAGTAVLGRLFVSPDTRGEGLGAVLAAHAAGHARERDLRPVLDVVATDTAAIALYERLGWERLGAEDQVWGPGRTVTLFGYAAPSRSARKSSATAQVRSAASAS
ncbi:GNAT family N-acetyltransferase [Kitasatospora sp. NPDC004240]